MIVGLPASARTGSKIITRFPGFATVPSLSFYHLINASRDAATFQLHDYSKPTRPYLRNFNYSHKSAHQ
ncbi:Hypothetical predicted protein [Cloeon dipterum]|uniref:Uncharacterized protein n=1 Tax=Cloeon dipterum TaxID=197152 RepID=A0A8S1DR73_9INSE|nr:Hypothetical predicted protein [Cloeon dipterum]